MYKFQEGDNLLPVDETGKFIPSDVDYVDTWKAMEECVKLGLAKGIGLSNFNSQQIQRVLDVATVTPLVNQVCIMMIYIRYNKKTLICPGDRGLHGPKF
jgi:aldehyde reductase